MVIPGIGNLPDTVETMKEEAFDSPVERRTTVATPHFHDRVVVLTAQPVVPLNEIRTRLKLRRLWFLGGAFVIALILGAASALVAVQVKRIAAGNGIPQSQSPQIQEPQTASETATADAQTLPVPIDAIGGSTVMESTEMEEEEPAKPVETVAPKRPEPVAHRPRIVNRESGTRREGEPSEEEALEQIREAVLYDRWQERRLRRVMRRERRRADRDLSHVDEIFEGRRRPERP